MSQEQAAQFRPPVRAVRLSDQVAAQIQSLIADRSLKPGDKLPSERELCDKLNVSRTVVREAVRSLVVKGLLEVRPGGGMVVSAPDTTLVSELMSVVLRVDNGEVSFRHVLEVRRLLEVEIAGLAAERRTEMNIAQMQECLHNMDEHGQDAETWAKADVAFHAALAVATQNPLYPILLGSITDILMEVRLTGFTLPGTVRRAIDYHIPILERIQQQDSAGARQAMQDHLQESEQTFQQARRSKSL